MENVDKWKPEVGKKIFIVSSYRDKCRTDVITKVGRKMFYVGVDYMAKAYLIDSKETRPDDYPREHCYESEEIYLKTRELARHRLEISRGLHLLTDEQVEIIHGWIENTLESKDK